MGKKILVVVDMQNDFVTGSLGTVQAQEIVSAAAEKIRTFDGAVFFTRDTHLPDYLQTQEGKNLPVEHCIRGTGGWEIISELKDLIREKKAVVIDKPTFGSTELAEQIRDMNPESVELIGLCTDICVVSNALLLKAFCPEIPILVDPACCAGVTPEKHEAALETMRSCQIRID